MWHSKSCMSITYRTRDMLYYWNIERAIVCVFDVNGECLEVNRDYKYLIYSGVNATTLSASTDSNSLLKSHTVL